MNMCVSAVDNGVRIIRLSLLLAVFFVPRSYAQDLSTSTWVTLSESEQSALRNHPSIRLAQEELDLAAAKRKEAFRAIWPNVALKGEQTEGDAVRDLGTPGFTEKSYGVQVNQPIFQGGRLYRVYRQASATWESLRAKYAKAQQEVIYSVREATWNLIKATLIEDVQRKALSDLTQEKTMADQLLAKDTIPQQVHLTILAQFHQSAYALEGAVADVEARLWQWTAALGLKSPPDFRPSNALENTPVQASMEDCLRLALANHPDLLMQRKAAEAAEQGNLAAKSLYYPKLSFNGSYGRSGGAFNGEDLHLGEDWLASLQISQYFGLNTLNVSGLQQETSPKIGQTTRTAAKTASGSLSILDGFKQQSERKEAQFNNDQAQVQRDRTEMEIANAVREAYANLKKAQAQLKIAENAVPLSKTEFEIAKIKSAHRESPYSERAIARNKLAQAETAWVEARAAYNIARAALNRAVGVPDRF